MELLKDIFESVCDGIFMQEPTTAHYSAYWFNSRGFMEVLPNGKTEYKGKRDFNGVLDDLSDGKWKSDLEAGTRLAFGGITEGVGTNVVSDDKNYWHLESIRTQGIPIGLEVRLLAKYSPVAVRMKRIMSVEDSVPTLSDANIRSMVANIIMDREAQWYEKFPEMKDIEENWWSGLEVTGGAGNLMVTDSSGAICTSHILTDLAAAFERLGMSAEEFVSAVQYRQE